MIGDWEIRHGDVLDELRKMPDESVQCVVTSPPYWGLRDYGMTGQIGLEKSLAEYIEKMVTVFREVRRVLRGDGTLWLNLGDSYASSGRSDRQESPGVGAKQEMKAPGRKLEWRAGGGHNFSWFIPFFGTRIKPKDLVGVPWRLAFALQADGWYLRSDIIWHKPNPMPESVTDRPTKAHEYLFLLAKSEHYYYDAEAIKEPGTSAPTKMPDGWDTAPGSHGTIHRAGRERGKRTEKQRGHGRRHEGFNARWDAMTKEEQCGIGRNKRSVWTIATKPYAEAHFATFPPSLVEPCILAGCPSGGGAGAGSVRGCGHHHSGRVAPRPSWFGRRIES